MFSERGQVFGLTAMLPSAVFRGPRNLIAHWGLQGWAGEAMVVWVNLDATGATIVPLMNYHRLTPHHLGIETVPIELSETMDELDALGTLLPGWNGYDVAAPKTSSILQAKKWIRQMYEDVTRM